METARACLAELLGGEEPVNVTVEKIFASVYQKFNVPKEDIIGQKRNKEIAEARHICVYLIREIIGMSYPNIGTVINRDHATILASYDKIRKKMIADPIFSIEVNEIIKEITGQA
jgi:chromosomal replication initiator protein